MAKEETGTGLKQDEFSKIFDEYRARIEEITRRAEKNLHSIDDAPGDEVAKNIERIEVLAKSALPGQSDDNGIQSKTEAPPVAAPEESPAPITSETLIKLINTPAPPPEESPAPVTSETLVKLINAPAPPPEPAPKLQAEKIGPTKVEAPAPPQPAPELNIEAVKIRNNGGRPAFDGYSEIIRDAKREAKKIIEEAEESARKDAKKRTQSQVEKIIEKAKKEAEDIIERAKRNADKVRDDVITESKREADYIIRDITQKYRQETEAQSSHAMADAQEKAQKMLVDISASTVLVGQRLTEIITRSKKTVEELETNLQAEATELSRIITDTQARLEEASKNARLEKPAPAPEPPRQVIENKVIPTLAVRLIGEKTPGNNGTGVLFSGQMEMKSISAEFDYQYLKKLKKYLVHIASIKYLQEYASEKEMSVLFDILEPLPLLDILSNIPMVDEVITRADDDFCLVFKNEE
jgi:vacuolar-type H+-ATPase subunit H